jgi:RHS repeat-associated protein
MISFFGISSRQNPASCLSLLTSVAGLFLILAGVVSGYAQVQPNIESGFKSYGSYDSSKVDTVNLGNGGLTIHIPLPFSYPQRGGKINPSNFLVSNSKNWQVNSWINSGTGAIVYYWDYSPGQLGLELDPGNFGPYITSTLPAKLQRTVVTQTNDLGQETEWDYGYGIRDWDGSVHELADISGGNRTSFASIDTSGYQATSEGQDQYGLPVGLVITDRKGNVSTLVLGEGGNPPCTHVTQSGEGGITTVTCTGGPSFTSFTDSNGNLYNSEDTLGRSSYGETASSSTTGCVSSLPLTGSTLYTYTGPTGNQETLQACLGNLTLQTAFGQSGVTEFPSSHAKGITPASMIVTLILPNNTKWTFSYDHYGDVTQLGLPTGGTISYTWTTTGVSNCGANIAQVSRAVASRAFNDGAGHIYTWNYTWGPWSNGSASNVVTDPLGNDTVHTFNYQCSPYEVITKQYNQSRTSGQLLREVDTTYSSYSFSGTGYGLYGAGEISLGNVVPTNIQTTDYASGMVTSTAKSYDPGYGANDPIFGNVTSESVYDWGSGAPGALLKQIATTYEFQNNSNYLTANLPDLVASVVVSNGAGYKCSETDYTYDNSSYLTASNVTEQHGAPPGAVRGNLSSKAQQLSSTPCQSGATWSPVTSYTNMYDTGEVYQSIDPLGHTTTYNYSSTFYGAYPTTVTNALNQSTTYNYDFSTGLMTSATDPNQLETTYSYDSMFRLHQVTHPDGGEDTIAYQETTDPFTATLTTQINSTQSKVETDVFDGLARVTEHQLSSDPQGTVYTDTTYDALSRVGTVSNPYREGADATTSSGITTYSYDALSRKIQESYPDTSVLTTAYCGPSTLVTDPTGKWRRSRVDGLGHLVEVDEPNSTTASVNSNGCPGTSDPIWVTSYTLDPLGNLDNVLQNASRQRSFTYDSLSRLLTSANPETGTITYVYNNDNTVYTKADARSITTTYSYDAIRRETGRTYSNNNPSPILTTYDQANCLNLTACQNIGHRTSMTDAAGSEVWAYEVDKTNLRSIHQEQRTITSSPNNITKTTTYYLDLAGNVTQLVYPTGRVVNYTFDSADRPSTAVDSANGITYAKDWETPPTNTNCVAGAVCYTPQGSVYGMSIGQTTSFTGFNVSETYNNRLQPGELKASSSAGSAIDITYNFVDPVSTHNAGHVYAITNNLNSSRSQAFTYDQVNRIVSAGTTATTGTYCWGYQYTYDAWGNLLSQAGWSPTYNACTETTMGTVTASMKNRLSGLTYDQSGNTLSDGSYSYTWDAESQMKTAAGLTYLYDGDGRRAAKVGSTLHWYGSGGEVLAETDTSGNTQNEYIFFGGKRVAMVPASGSALYYAEDMLGSSRVMVQSSGTLCYDADFTPYGAERDYTSTCAQNYKFEGKERDPETLNDDFGARKYTWRFGRWLSSDWSAVPAAVPYANLTNPQTLNLYAMVADDPESFADLGGHESDPRSPAAMYAAHGLHGWDDEDGQDAEIAEEHAAYDERVAQNNDPNKDSRTKEDPAAAGSEAGKSLMKGYKWYQFFSKWKNRVRDANQLLDEENADKTMFNIASRSVLNQKVMESHPQFTEIYTLEQTNLYLDAGRQAGKAMAEVPGPPGYGEFGESIFNSYGRMRDANNQQIDVLLQEMASSH